MSSCVFVDCSLLITLMGHIKLTDFGLSKMGLMNRTFLSSSCSILDTDLLAVWVAAFSLIIVMKIVYEVHRKTERKK